jgi:hypothetical protein
VHQALDARDPTTTSGRRLSTTECVELLVEQRQPHDECLKLVAHLLHEREALCTFLARPGVDATNWRRAGHELKQQDTLAGCALRNLRVSDRASGHPGWLEARLGHGMPARPSRRVKGRCEAPLRSASRWGYAPPLTRHGALARV